MAAYVKHLDPNHLVTVGEEGFFGEQRPEAAHNPQGWGGQIGQDFVLDHSSPSIDFATIHVWPDNWQRCASPPHLLCYPGSILGSVSLWCLQSFYGALVRHWK